MTDAVDWQACARIVQQGDPFRFRCAMAAPVSARAILFPLYAFNVEVSRAPWLTTESMIAEMRLQWWRDVCEEIAGDGVVRRHEVATPLASVLDAQGANALDQLIAIRRWDIYKDAFEDADHFADYIDKTSGNLMWTAARLLGATEEAPVRDAGFAAGLASWLIAIPALEAQGRIPLVEGTMQAVSALAAEGLERLSRARQGSVPRNARAALVPAAAADSILKVARDTPERVAQGDLPILGQGLRFTFRAATGRW